MLSDETFPVDFIDDEPFTNALNAVSCASVETFETSNFSSENYPSSTETSSVPTSAKSDANEKTNEFSECSFVSFDTSNRKLSLKPPNAPSKKIKSHSCQDLQQSKISYDHVESKVKQFIQNINDVDRKRKLSRHKSMPISSQQAVDDSFSEEKDSAVLIKELRKKSIKIYELEEKLDNRESRIYALEYERSKMKMTFDKLRIEMHDLKEMENEYKQLLVLSPTKRLIKHTSVQTDDIPQMTQLVNRELTFSSDLTAIANQSLNQTHFSDTNNASSDNLIPLPEMSCDEIDNLTKTLEEAANDESDVKKSKKFRRFLKMMSCVSK